MKRLAPLAALALAACGHAPAPPAHALRHPTIVSLNPCTDAVLARMAGPRQLLALSHYSRDPRSSSMDVAAARRFGVTGGTAEEVLALDPDVVVAGSFLAPATRAAFERMGIRVETFGIAGDISQSEAQVRRLARIAGNEPAGRALIARMEAALQSRPGERRISAVLWQPGGIVPGGGALVSQLLDRAGFDSLSARRGMGQADYLSLEQVAADPPEVLLVAGSERGQHHPLLARIPGLRRAAFDPSLLYCGGPTVIRAMERLRAIRRDVAA